MEKNNIIHLSERSENIIFSSILSFFLFFTIYIDTYGTGNSTFLRVLFYIMLFFSPVLLIGSIYSFLLGFKNLRLKQLIEGTATSKIRSLAIGFAEVYGKITPLKVLKSPITNHNCAYWQVIIMGGAETGLFKHNKSSTEEFLDWKYQLQTGVSSIMTALMSITYG